MWKKIGLWMALLAGWLGMVCGTASAAPVTMQVADGDVRSALLSAARVGGINLVLDGSVDGTVTLSLTAEPEEILRHIAAVRGLSLIPEGDHTYLVTAAKGDGLREAHIWPVQYADPHELAQAVNLSLGKEENSFAVTNNNRIGNSKNDEERAGKTVESGTIGRVLVDEATSSLVYYGTAAEAARVERIARQLDVPARQVSLEARVVALTRDGSKSIGTELGGEGTDETIIFRHDPAGGPLRGTFDVKLHELIQNGQAKILARPNITTIQGHEARINIGGEVPVPRSRSTYRETTTEYDYKQAGIILRCTPRVNADGGILAEVHTEVSTPEYVADMKAYRFQKRSADTRVRLQDGKSMVIGGLIGREESRNLSRIPFLSSLPILGSFFQYVHHTHQESEIMIFLTAHVLPVQGEGACGSEKRSR